MVDSKQLKVVIAVHKAYKIMPDSVYLPVQVGSALSKQDLGYQPDSQGENISEKNPVYCELTGLYWAWKNLSSDALGLMHYRRYLGHPSRYFPWKRCWERIATGDELAYLLEKAPILLPKKRHYIIESREGQFIHAHGSAALDLLRDILQRYSPQYLPAFQQTMKRTSGHYFNMFVMRRDLSDAYCHWLFETLFAVEAAMEKNMPEKITPRLFGFLAERLMDCWIETNGYRYLELPVVYIEKQNLPKKGIAFLMRKFGLKRRCR